MNKSELIDFIAHHADVPRTTAAKTLEATLAAVEQTLKAGEELTLVGFGSFTVAQREERIGRNPKTGESITIEAARIPKFRAGKALKDALN